MTKYELQIGGMSCDDCAQTISNSLNELAAVEAAVSFARSNAVIQADDHIMWTS